MSDFEKLNPIFKDQETTAASIPAVEGESTNFKAPEYSNYATRNLNNNTNSTLVWLGIGCLVLILFCCMCFCSLSFFANR